MLTGLIVLVIFGTTVWVYADAKQLGVQQGWASERGFLDAGTVGWAAAVLLVWIIAFPYYLAMRPRYVRISTSRSSDGPPQ